MAGEDEKPKAKAKGKAKPNHDLSTKPEGSWCLTEQTYRLNETASHHNSAVERVEDTVELIALLPNPSTDADRCYQLATEGGYETNKKN